MNPHRARNLIPPIYALLVIAGFLISATAGIVALIIGGSLGGLLWSATERPPPRGCPTTAQPATSGRPPGPSAAQSAAEACCGPGCRTE